MKKSIWEQANWKGKLFILVFLSGFILGLVAIFHNNSPKQIIDTQTCLTINQATVLINNLHNANNTDQESSRALQAIEAFHGKVIILNKKTHEVTFSWECLK